MITNLLLKRLLLLWVFAFSASLWGQTTTFFNFTGTSGYLATPAAGWTSVGTEGGGYLKLSPGSVTSPIYAASNDVVFKYDIGSFNSGTGTNTKLIVLNSADVVIREYTLYSTTGGGTYTKGQTVNVGSVSSNFKIKIQGLGDGTTVRGTRMQNYSLVGVVAPTCATSVFSFDSASVNKVTGDAAFTNTFTTNNTSPTVYSSNNTGVATVNASTGEVSVGTAGNATISVTQIADGTHCAVSSSYTLNVSSSTPLVNITGIANNGSVCANSSDDGVTYTITNSGASAADGITVSSSDPQFVVSDISSTSIPTNGTATFKVTFTPTSAGDKSSTITVTSTTAGSNTATYGLTGKGLNTPPTVTTPTSTAITASTATLGGNITIQGCSPITERGIYYSTINNFAEGTGTKVSEEGSFTTGVFTVNASGLNSSTTYYYKAFATSESGTAYSTQGTFITTAIAAPVATAATDISETGFTANWEAVAGATGYELEVSKSPTFGTFTSAIATEGFETGLISSYQTGNITLSSGVWAVTNVYRGTTGVKSGSYSAQLQSATGSALVSPLFTAGVSSLSFWVSSGSGGALQVNYSTDGGLTWLAAPNSPFTGLGTTVVQKTVVLNTVVPTMIQIKRTAATVYIDDIEINYGSSTPDFVAGYNPKIITDGSTVTSNVTGLNTGTKYYYRVRAKDATSESVNSNVIDVTTLGSITWGNSGWSNEIGPDAAKNAVIDYDYAGTAFEAKSVKVNLGKTLTINSSVTTGDVTNNGAIILNDGASFIQSSTGLYDGSGTFKVNRNTESEAAKYAFWSSPVVNQDMYGIFPTAPEYVMIYNTGSNYYDIVTGPANASKGIGYSISTPSPAPGAAAFLGAPHNGTFNTVLALDSYKFNLVGNPYPSNLDLTKLLSANSDNIESTIWFWDNKSGPVKTQNGTTAASNGYATFNAAGTGVWVPATSVSASEVKSGVTAKIGQGFIVKAKSSALLFNNDMRTADVGSNFNKSTGNADEGKYWLTLTTPYNTKITQAITYQNGGSDRYDDYDSKARSNGSDAFYSLAGAEKVIIQGKAPFNADDIVVLGNKHFENGNFKIELTKTEGLFAEGQAIYLRDKVTGTETNLQEGTYLFASNAGDFTDRFEVVYSKTVLGTNAAAKSTLAVYRNGDDFVIDSPSKIVAVEVYDASGKLMKSFKSNSNKETVSNLSRGVYILKITTATETVSKKVIK